MIAACHARAVDRIRFGRSVKALRARRGWRQQDLADAARISRTVAGRIERGELRSVGWRDMEAVAGALDGQLGIDFRWRGADLDRLLDADHAAIVEVLVSIYIAAGWETIVEATFSEFGERGSIDVLAWHAPTGQVAVNEVKASIGNAGATVMGIDRKARLAPVIARKLAWTCQGVSRFLVVRDNATSRRRVAVHGAIFQTSFPARGRMSRAWIRQPTSRPVAGLFFLSPVLPEAAKRQRSSRNGARPDEPRSGRRRREPPRGSSGPVEGT
jgi:transcriptional regulator with XRE-family HTH domain